MERAAVDLVRDALSPERFFATLGETEQGREFLAGGRDDVSLSREFLASEAEVAQRALSAVEELDRAEAPRRAVGIGKVTFACEEPVRLAEFWAGALGYAPAEVPAEVLAEVQRTIDAQELDPTGWAMLVPPDGVGPRLLFQRAPKAPTAAIPIHLDLEVDDREAEVSRLCELGATVVETKSRRIGSFTEAWTVMRDPEANGFCVQ